MASSPPRGQPATAAPPAPAATTSPQVPAASHPLPRAFLASSSPRAAAAAPPVPPLFTGRPLNPSAPGHASSAPHGILYPVTKPISTSAAAQLRRVPPMAVGYPRAHPVAVPIAQPPQPLVHSQPRSFAAVPRALVAGVVARPEQQPPRGVPIAPQPKVNPVPPGAPSSEQVNPKDREDTTTVVINDRKVNLLDSESGSLYALCRSWVRNGVPHESQPSFGNGEPILPRPLPASVVDSRISDKENNDAADVGSDEEPQKNADGEYNTSDLLKQHVKRAKRIRAGLQKERLRRIERYKQRLALLL
ncbi:formin-like protein 6 isoform X2 [Setaria italica]|uniref:formin-like protein 6 isoform X2 n=1 Tax=Setaria italica TaxID=4555 RepID=UPI000BE6131B|nr:formin-like protein 6 isoform X2 [Setaria italica]